MTADTQHLPDKVAELKAARWFQDGNGRWHPPEHFMGWPLWEAYNEMKRTKTGKETQ